MSLRRADPLMGSFRASLIQLSRDGVIDRPDLQQLRAAGKRARKGSDDAWMAQQVLAFLDKYTEPRQIRYGIPGQQLDFAFTPAYAESDVIPGESVRQKLSRVSQADTLTQTDDDGNRCGSASLLNAWLLLGGNFAEAAARLGLEGENDELTYARLHTAQEALFDAVNTDGSEGLSTSYSITHRGNEVVALEPRGEVWDAIDKLGLTGELLLSRKLDALHQRQEIVSDFWQRHPQGVLLTGLYLDVETGALRSPSADERQNHFVLVFQDADKRYLLDTGASDNGVGNSLHELSPEQFEGFVYQNAGSVIGLTKPI
ncbi:MAG: hypothetical protein ACAI44_26710 [Candidatus Sericytochromatia bacterium]